MIWTTRLLPEAEDDFDELDGSQKKVVQKAIKKTEQNPLPRNEGGYGIPLGNKRGVDLTNFFEIKLRGAGLRVIYKLIRTEAEMLVVIIGVREGEEIYGEAQERIDKYGL